MALDRPRTELTITEAAHVTGQKRLTVWAWLDRGHLAGTQRGLAHTWYIQVETLRAFCQRHHYEFDEGLAHHYLTQRRRGSI